MVTVSRVLSRVEKREEPEILSLSDGVVLVIVALSAGERRTEPDFGRGVDPIDYGGDAELLGIGPAFGVRHRVAVGSGRDMVRRPGVRQQVACDLPDRELIERHVLAERIDNPVPVGPNRPAVVLLVTVGVGVSGKIEPPAGQMLAVRGGSCQPVERDLDRAPRIAGMLLDERVDIRGHRGQAGQVEAEPPEEDGGVGRRGRRQPSDL
jgi:hypothetical protein